MSKRLKLCSGAEAVQKFKKAGWSAVRQKGSHVMLTKPGYQENVGFRLLNPTYETFPRKKRKKLDIAKR
ncbi:MAG: type II toxin-antitoxin system HicA family toxin [Planctomycetes bacterium]|uniref:type II toxin-antitoxin system HicA family toxin n=1 Tax=Candidatus Wunengus sp. YC65 TaxID=3367701 RepID=UPI001DE483F1|nr:type II toxin-antitoxin system HicA family toxin [Planctomycetota bacterium]